MASTVAPSRGSTPAAESPPINARGFKVVSFMRHSIALHNEAAGTCPDPMSSVYLNEAYADSSLSSRGLALVKAARMAMTGLSPAPDIVLCSPLTRTIQTALAMFEGTRTPIMVTTDVREAYGRFPCDRHKDKRELQQAFGDSVDLSLCDETDTAWTRDHREEMSHLNYRAASFVERAIRREEAHVFVVSHGVFMESVIGYLTSNGSGHNHVRVHNCEVHSFVFSVPATGNSSIGVHQSPTMTTSSTWAAPAAAATTAPSYSPATVPSQKVVTPLHPAPPQAREAAARTTTMATTTTTTVATQSNPMSRLFPDVTEITAAEERQRQRPLLETYLTGQELALACAAAMPLQAAAHIGRLFRNFGNTAPSVSAQSGVGEQATGTLDETQFTAFLAKCGVCAEEAKFLFLGLDYESTGAVDAKSFVHAMMAFYPAGAGAPAAGGHDSRAASVIDLRKRYLKEMDGTSLGNYDRLECTIHRLLSALLAMPSS